MTNEDDTPSPLSITLGHVLTTEHNGTVYMDVDTILATNLAVVTALDPRIHPVMRELPEGFLDGVIFTLDLYRRLHAGVMIRHAEDLVPDHIPDGMDDVV